MAHDRNANLNSLCNFILDSTNFIGESGKRDVKDLCSSIVMASQCALLSNEKACLEALCVLNDELATKWFLLGGLKLSEVDIFLFAAAHPVVIKLGKSEVQKLPHVLRWMNFLQSRKDLAELFEQIAFEKVPADKTKVKGNANAKDTPKTLKINGGVEDVDKNLKNCDESSKKNSEPVLADITNVEGNSNAKDVDKSLKCDGDKNSKKNNEPVLCASNEDHRATKKADTKVAEFAKRASKKCPWRAREERIARKAEKFMVEYHARYLFIENMFVPRYCATKHPDFILSYSEHFRIGRAGSRRWFRLTNCERAPYLAKAKKMFDQGLLKPMW